MIDIECLGCENRAICGPIFDEQVPNIFRTALENGTGLPKLDPMTLIIGQRATEQLLKNGDETGLDQFIDKYDIGEAPEELRAAEAVLAEKLLDAGCTLSQRGRDVRLIEYVQGHMVSLVTGLIEEELSRATATAAEEIATMASLASGDALLARLLSESAPTSPKPTMEERRQAAVEAYCVQEGWDQNSLDFSQRMEITGHLRDLDLM